MRSDYQPKRTWKKIVSIIESRHMAHFRHCCRSEYVIIPLRYLRNVTASRDHTTESCTWEKPIDL